MIPVVRSPDAGGHVPGAEIWLGTRTLGTEVPQRVDAIEAALADWIFIDALPHSDEVLLRVHDPSLVEHLRTVWPRWGEYGVDRVVPYLFPTPGLLGELPLRDPVAVHAVAGRYCYDTMTLVGPGTWLAARGAVNATLTAVGLLEVHECVYALTRPPGHHVTRSAYGGSCYLNNAAVAAEGLRGVGHERVAIVDIDAHHGNGTQDIFYSRGDIFYCSVHVDPGAGWFPHYAGFADEVGIEAGVGANLNVPLAPGAADEAWLVAIAHLVDAISEFSATALVVSLGVDAAIDDPESPLQVTPDGFHRAGQLLRDLRLPTLAVQEGGYDLATLGGLVRTTLEGLGR